MEVNSLLLTVHRVNLFFFFCLLSIWLGIHMVQRELTPPLDSRYGHVAQIWPMRALCRTLGDLSGKKLCSPLVSLN